MRKQIVFCGRCFAFASFGRYLAAAFVFLLTVFPVFSQLPTGTIRGVVKDSSGATVPDANVSVTNVDTNDVRTTTTGSDGAFRVPALQPGHYSVKVEKTGFKTQTETSLTLDVAQELVANSTMQVGSTAQEVVVTGEAPLVNTTTSALGGLVNDTKMADLPLNGRNFVDLALMQPGIANDSNYTNSSSQGGGVGVWFSSNGSPIRSNNFTIDGAPMMNLRGTTANAIGATLGVDGIREYRVITDSFSAEYGLTMGSQVVIVSKGGSNRFSGDAFEFLRNNVLDARNYFDAGYLITGKRLPELQRNNFGGSFGGPIRKDKTFFYGVYEALRLNFGATIITNTFPSNCFGATANPCATLSSANTPVGTVAASIRPLLALYPTPNIPGQNNFTYPANDPSRVDYGQIRVDHNFSASDSFFGRYTVDDSSSITDSKFTIFQVLNAGRDQFLTLSENHIFSPTLLNTARSSFSRTNLETLNIFQPSQAALTGSQYSCITGDPVCALTISGVSALGSGGVAPVYQVQNVFTVSDDLYYSKGRHGLKFGMLWNRYEDYNVDSLGYGSATFTSEPAFLAGLPSVISRTDPSSNETRAWVFYTYGFYVQDDWRVTPRLTLNLGLRYEFNTTPRDKQGRDYAFHNLRDPSENATTQGPIFTNPSFTNFGPHVGLAWDVTGRGKTSVRAAFGEYYDLGNIGFVLYNQPQGTPPLATNSSATLPTTSTTPSVTLPLTFTTVSNALHTILYKISQPHMLQYNLTVEQQLPFGVGLSMSYVGTRGIHLWMGEEGNPCEPTSITNQIPFWANDCGRGRVNPNWAAAVLHSTNGSSNYNSFQMSLNKRLSHGLELQGAYAWGKVLDVSQGEGGTGECVSSGSGNGVYPDNKRLYDYGPPCFDVGNNLRVNLLYHLPGVKSDEVLARTLLRGWWTGSLVSWQTGYPFTPVLGGWRSLSDHLNNNSNQTDHASLGTATVGPNQVGPDGSTNTTGLTFVPFDKSKVITGNPTQWYNPLMFTPGPIGFLGTASRDDLRGPRLSNWDFSLNKDTALPILGENGKLVFRAEFFNILNHANFGMPNGTTYSGALTDIGDYKEKPTSNAGQITNTVTTSRQIQLALKIIF